MNQTKSAFLQGRTPAPAGSPNSQLAGLGGGIFEARRAAPPVVCCYSNSSLGAPATRTAAQIQHRPAAAGRSALC